MIYLYWYFGIGVVVLVTVYMSHRLAAKKDEPELHEILRSFDPDKDKWHYKLGEKILVPLLAVTLMPLIWPLLIYWKITELLNKKEYIEEQKEQEFKVTKTDLIERTTIADIEVKSQVVDPLDASPALPFGHLNPAWEKFKSNLLGGDQIWTFKTRWEQKWLKQECTGYAILRGDEISHFWKTGWVNIEPPPDPPKPIPTFDEIEKKLKDKKWETRWSVVQDKQCKLTDEQIERALRDKERLVRFAIAKRNDLVLTPNHIEIGLADKDDSVREVFSYRWTYKLTPEQLERGLTDKNSMNRLRILGRAECALTPAQIERCLTDEDCCVRWHLAERKDYTPTAVQIERGLADRSEEVRLAFASRADIFLTQAQIERGLNDESKQIQVLFAELKVLSLNQANSEVIKKAHDKANERFH